MPVGKLEEFDTKSGNWTAYVERLESYYVANNVQDTAKLPTLIAVMGESAYELLSTLTSPKKPATLKLEEVVQIMKDHLQPAPSPLAERYQFRQRRQQAGETIGDYVAELKKLARYCVFGMTLEENLRDQFVCGIRSDVIRQRLFAESKLITYSTALRLATALEAAERDAATVDRNVTSQAAEQLKSEMNALQFRGSSAGGGSRSILGQGSTAGRGRGGDGGGGTRGIIRPIGAISCTSCGGRDHSPNNCKFKNYICSKCGNMGHLRRVCVSSRPTMPAYGRNGGNQRTYNNQYSSGSSRTYHLQEDGGERNVGQPAEERAAPGEHEEEPVMQMSLANYKPVSIPLIVGGRELVMEIDTGSALSCISKRTYEHYYSKVPLLS